MLWLIYFGDIEYGFSARRRQIYLEEASKKFALLSPAIFSFSIVSQQFFPRVKEM